MVGSCCGQPLHTQSRLPGVQRCTAVSPLLWESSDLCVGSRVIAQFMSGMYDPGVERELQQMHEDASGEQYEATFTMNSLRDLH